MRILSILVLIACLASCKAPYLTKKEKKAVATVKNSQHATDSLIRWYLQKNPPKNDTLYMPGEPVVTETVKVDSVLLPYPVNHRYTEVRTIEKVRVDTVQVNDRKFVQALENRLNGIEAKMVKLQKERDDFEHLAEKRWWIIVALLVILAAIIFGGLYLFLMKKKYQIIRNVTS